MRLDQGQEMIWADCNLRWHAQHLPASGSKPFIALKIIQLNMLQRMNAAIDLNHQAFAANGKVDGQTRNRNLPSDGETLLAECS